MKYFILPVESFSHGTKTVFLYQNYVTPFSSLASLSMIKLKYIISDSIRRIEVDNVIVTSKTIKVQHT